MAGKDKYTIAQVRDALIQAQGMKSVAARKLGCVFNTIQNYCKRHPTLATLVDNIREDTLDQAEIALQSLIRPPRDEDGNFRWKPDLGAICFYLKCIGKHRGFVERQEHDIQGDMTLTIELPLDFPTKDYDDPEVNPESPTRPPAQTNGSARLETSSRHHE